MTYEIEGGSLPVVICKLNAGESLITESGGMSWMTDNIKMDSGAKGGLGKAFGRMFSGDSFFQTEYKAEGSGEIAFSSSFPGSIKAVKVQPGKSVIVQKSAFLASESSVELSVFFQKKLGAGLFGGEGFIMQKLSGQGVAFVEIDGYAKEYELAAGEKMLIDTGYLAMMDDTVKMDIQMVKGVKNMLFGGEGVFNTVVTGPGKVVLQSMPLARTAGLIGSFLDLESKK